MKIALIDDDTTTNFIHKNKLQKLLPNATIVVFTNASDALTEITNGIIFNYAFLDLNMPVMNGLEFLVEHRKIKPQHKIEKIILFINQDVSNTFINKNELFTTIQKPLDEQKIREIFAI